MGHESPGEEQIGSGAFDSARLGARKSGLDGGMRRQAQRENALMRGCVGYHHGNQLRDEIERECNHGMS